MAQSAIDKTINDAAIKNGLIIGGVSIALTVVLYFVAPAIQYTNLWISFLMLAITIALIVILAIDTRKKIGNYWTYGQAYRNLIITTVIFCLISICVSFIMVKFIDPSISDKIKQTSLDRVSSIYEKNGMDQAEIDSKMEKMSKDMDERMQPTFKNELTNFGVSLLMFAVIDLIIAAIVKKNPPMFAPVIDGDPTTI